MDMPGSPPRKHDAPPNAAETVNIRADGVVYLPETDERVPCAVVWTALPGITHLLPPVGHVGITDSRGVVFDFSGPHRVTVGSLMCGPARRAWRLHVLSPRKDDDAAAAAAAEWDAAVAAAARDFACKQHHLVVQNCHSHVASVLNRVRYDARADWNQLRLALAIWTRGRWTSRGAAFWTLAPFFVLVSLVVVLPVVLTHTR